MPTENAPRGNNAFYVNKSKGGKGKGKGGKNKDKDNNRGTKRAMDPSTSLSSFGSSSSAPAAK
jgi:hypothetical protein